MPVDCGDDPVEEARVDVFCEGVAHVDALASAEWLEHACV